MFVVGCGQVPIDPALVESSVFQGYLRPGKRGVGTRNTVIVLGTSSRTSHFATALKDHFLAGLAVQAETGSIDEGLAAAYVVMHLLLRCAMVVHGVLCMKVNACVQSHQPQQHDAPHTSMDTIMLVPFSLNSHMTSGTTTSTACMLLFTPRAVAPAPAPLRTTST